MPHLKITKRGHNKCCAQTRAGGVRKGYPGPNQTRETLTPTSQMICNWAQVIKVAVQTKGKGCMPNPHAGVHDQTTTTKHLPTRRGACPTPEDGMHGTTTSTNHLPRRRGACPNPQAGMQRPNTKSWDARPNNQTQSQYMRVCMLVAYLRYIGNLKGCESSPVITLREESRLAAPEAVRVLLDREQVQCVGADGPSQPRVQGIAVSELMLVRRLCRGRAGETFASEKATWHRQLSSHSANIVQRNVFRGRNRIVDTCDVGMDT